VVPAALGGLIWTIQENWHGYGAEHQRPITRVVLGLMVANVALAIALVQRDELLAWANAALVVALFVVTGRRVRAASRRTRPGPRS